ncbi:MAG: hypothetical protein A3A83_03320 [Candidatus Doudnabacteria bacterium RIFCSPLOWO2_01_FULL_48_57]|nr:MAG: hypothetical protein A2668_00755 [Candidatus Doudnabacteria bacterium RIFCSPHIGHO2_01_FULL_48_180]OGE98173.1 MAG: hypothetical protein A3A83_03320 [Candidatus Doudnabacteria bacterium RIFCSPLOWO2_01_FULL_48_57]
MAIIITKNGKDARKISPSDFAKEGHIQQYIYDNPDAIPLYDINEDIRLLILAREFPTGSGPIDAIGTDRDGNIYLVETKLYRNPDKRTVVAQVLDYGASLWRNGGSFNEFTATLDEASKEQFNLPIMQEMQKFFAVSEEEASGILENMAKNLDGGNFKFVVLMDKLHGRLKDLIVFINQNSKFDLYAVELEYYKYEQHEIVIPRLFGAEVKKDIAVQGGPRKKWGEELFMEAARKEAGDPKQLKAIEDILRFAESAADLVDWGTGTDSGSFTFKVNYPGAKRGLPIPLFTVWTKGTIVLRFGRLIKVANREVGEKFYDALSKIPEIGKLDKDKTLGTDYSTRFAIGDLLPDAKDVEQFKAAILAFLKEIK